MKENLRLYKKKFQRVNVKAHCDLYNLINSFIIIINLKIINNEI